MRINVCRDPALVTSACLRIRGRRREFYLWRDGWRPRCHLGRAEQ